MSGELYTVAGYDPGEFTRNADLSKVVKNFGQGDFPFYIVSLPAFMQRKAEPPATAPDHLRSERRLRPAGEVCSVVISNSEPTVIGKMF